ncbi:hypothetical protein N1I86_14335 [Bacillus sp. FSL W8-0116]|uniref:hypothetical protein n=1 Tax=Bacillus sp. FSL W8-0116 TaxID=2978206 RepID=UPI0030FB1468
MKNEEKADIEALRQIEGVMGVVDDGTLQIIVGPGTVNKVADAISRSTGIKIGEETAEPDELTFEERAALKKANIKSKNQTPFKNFLSLNCNIKCNKY